MNAEYKNELIDLLSRLKNNTGHFIIASDSFDIEHDNTPGDGFFCQFFKNSLDEPFYFEALSHYFDDKVKTNLKKSFFELGFSLDVDENYSKRIILNSTNDITNVCNEVELIFETLYKVSPDHPYYFDDQIELLNAQSSDLKLAEKSNSNNYNKTTITDSPKNKISIGRWILILFILYVAYVAFFDKKESYSTTQNSSEFMYVVKEEAFTTSNENDFDEMYTYIVQNDMTALQSMVNNGKITVLAAGTEVYMMNAGLSYKVVRVSGSTEKLWIANERLRKK